MMTEKERKYFDAIQLNEGAYFYQIGTGIYQEKIKGAFNAIKGAAIGYKQICKIVREQVDFDGKAAKVSLLLFYSNTYPSFLPMNDVKLVLDEKTVGYLLLIEIGEFLALFSRNVKGLSDFKKNLMIVSSQKLCGAVMTDTSRFTRIKANNMNMNPNAIRNQSWEANNLGSVMSTFGTNHNVLNSIRVACDEDDDEFNISLNTSRVSKFAGARKNIPQLCQWCDKIISGILNPKDIEQSFLRHFAKPIKWKDKANELKPTYLLLDFNQIKDIINKEGYEVRYNNGKEHIISGRLLARLIKRIDRCLALYEEKEHILYKTSILGSDILVKLNVNQIKIDVKGALKNIEFVNDANKEDFKSLVNSNSAFFIGFDDVKYIYSNGGLNQDIGILNNLDSILSILEPLEGMNNVTSEKGEIKGMDDFQSDTVFYVVEKYFANQKVSHIVCDDMGFEVADHIVVSKNSISFIHSKAKGLEEGSLSASYFQEVIGQALKNIGFLRDLPIDDKIKAWKDSYFKDSNIPKYRLGNNIDDFKIDYMRVLQIPNGVKEICLAVDFISKSELQVSFDRLRNNQPFRQRTSVIQMAWLLNSFISACKEADINGRIFCRQ